MAEYFARENDSLQALAATLNERLLAEDQFRSRLGEILALLEHDGLVVDTQVRLPSQPAPVLAHYGRSLPREPFQLSSSDGQTGAVEVVVQWWVESRPSNTEWRAAVPQLTTGLFKLVSAHWGERDALSLLPRITLGSTRARLENALALQCETTVSTTGAFLDLDLFKQVNTQFSYDVGSKVIAAFASRLRAHFGDDSLIVHQGGDEFLVILADSSVDDALCRLDRFRRFMSSELFRDLDRVNTCTIAVAGYPDLGVNAAGTGKWLPLFETAFQSLTAKKPDRSVILFPSVADQEKHPTVTARDLYRSVLLARADVRGQTGWTRSFDAALIRALEEQIAATGSTLAVIAEIADEMLRALSVPRGLMLAAGQTEHNRDFQPTVRWIASMLAALLRSVFVGAKPFDLNDVLYLAPSSDSTAIELQVRDSSNVTRTSVTVAKDVRCESGLAPICLGRAWVSSTSTGTTGVPRVGAELGRAVSPFVVLEVGDARVEPAISLAAATSIRVDSRPVTGGGLPDFWQSNVARVVTVVLENPNIAEILVCGEQQNIQKTIQFLEARSRGEPVKSYIARRLGFDDADMTAFTSRRVGVRQVVDGPDGALQAAAQAIWDAGHVSALARPITAQRRLARRIQLPSPAAAGLTALDGLRMQSLAEAYPAVIQLLRTMKGDAQRDRSDRGFIELPAFKVVLENASSDTIPEFWSDEDGRAELREYYRRVFEATGGLFAGRLRNWRLRSDERPGRDQIQHAQDAVVSAVQQRIADRRILLTIGAPTDDGAQPLGLSVIHVLPRVFDRRWRIDFAWIWRSVEALVGFPFSAYGSITQSSAIVDAINEQLRATGGQQVSLGLLTYVALSLHMYVGPEGDDEIARAVITEALA